MFETQMIVNHEDIMRRAHQLRAQAMSDMMQALVRMVLRRKQSTSAVAA